MKLVDSSYAVLNNVTTASLDKSAPGRLPPDWIVIDKKTGTISKAPTATLTTNFSFDALRAPWRIALDYQWNQEPRAKAYLDKLSLFKDEWRNKKAIAASYNHDGSVINSTEVPAVYGGVMGYFVVSDPADADAVYNTKLKALFNPDTNSWKKPLGYYDDNWVWFGLGLYNNLIRPL
jgi:endoglucanase